MRRKAFVVLIAVALAGLGQACSTGQAASMQDAVSRSLEQAGFNDIRVTEDRNKGVIILNGVVRSEQLKKQAGMVAEETAPGRIIANQLSIEPVGAESKARSIEADVDEAIGKNYKAALIANHLDDQGIRYEIKNGVLTLNGRVKNRDIRSQAEKVAASVPNVQQVVNEMDVDGR